MPDNLNWSLVYDRFIPEEQGLREALCTLGNGYFFTRGAFAESSQDEINYPGTYLAGGYNRLKTEVAGKIIENEDLVNMPNWLLLSFKIKEGEWFKLENVEILSFRQELNLKTGVLIRKIRFKDAHERISILEDRRLIHMRFFHIAAEEMTLTAENWSGSVEILSALDGNVINYGVARYRNLNAKHLTPLESGVDENGNIFLQVQTNQSKIQIALASKTKLFLDQGLFLGESKERFEEGRAEKHIQFRLKRGQTARVEKILTLYTSKDRAISEPLLEAKDSVANASDFNTLFSSHALAWKSLWDESDIEIETSYDPPTEARSQLILRLHIFHLLQTVNYNSFDLDTGVPARGWHGEAYRGHIFWDELFIFPLLNLRIPKATLAMLKYRYRRLDKARENAKKAGFKGAMFPWQSGSNGREESQQIHLNPKSGRWLPDRTFIQRHVNVAIAYNFWRFFEVTNDMEFLRSYGAEVILEIARFLASLTVYNSEKEKYEILCVMGPDEYHDAYPDSDTPGLNNNAYTNLMSVWTIQNAIKLLNLLPDDHRREIFELLNLCDEEVEEWKKITSKMFVPFIKENLISQFEGYEKLLEFPWERYRKKYGNIQRLDRILESEGDSANRYKISKQADALMLFYLLTAGEIKELLHNLGYSFDTSQIPENVTYYLHRTSHGSTLSRIVHSWVLSRQNRKESWDLFLNALESDITDIQGGTTQEGIHLGSMAGTVDIVQRCWAGIEPKEDVLWLNPRLSCNLKKMRFHIHYRGHSIEIEIDHEKIKAVSKYSLAKSIWIGLDNQTKQLYPGSLLEFDLRKNRPD